MRSHSLIVAFSWLLALPVHAQTPQKGWAPASGAALANDYARRGEHEKVVFLFERLSAEEQTSLAVFPVYLASLQALKRYKEAEKLAKKAVKLRPEDAGMGVALGGVYAAAGDAPAAEKQWQKVLAQLTPTQVLPVATEFGRRELPQWAERTYLRGRVLAKNDTEYAPQLIRLHPKPEPAPGIGRNPAPRGAE